MFARDVDSRKRKATSSPPEESGTVSASAKIPSLVMESERFRWIKKNKSGERIETGSKWFVFLKNCQKSARPSSLLLEEGEHVEFETATVSASRICVMENVFFFLLRREYSLVTGGKNCTGCDPKIDAEAYEYGDHVKECIEYEAPVLDKELLKRCALKISARRLHAAACDVSHMYKIHESQIPVKLAVDYLSNMDEERFSEICSVKAESEVEKCLSGW